jgi:hypothetical protein
VTITNVSAGYSKQFQLGRWSQSEQSLPSSKRTKNAAAISS